MHDEVNADRFCVNPTDNSKKQQARRSKERKKVQDQAWREAAGQMEARMTGEPEGGGLIGWETL